MVHTVYGSSSKLIQIPDPKLLFPAPTPLLNHLINQEYRFLQVMYKVYLAQCLDPNKLSLKVNGAATAAADDYDDADWSGRRKRRRCSSSRRSKKKKQQKEEENELMKPGSPLRNIKDVNNLSRIYIFYLCTLPTRLPKEYKSNLLLHLLNICPHRIHWRTLVFNHKWTPLRGNQHKYYFAVRWSGTPPHQPALYSIQLEEEKVVWCVHTRAVI